MTKLNYLSWNVLLLLVLFLCTLNVYAGAWGRAAKSGYFQTSFTYLKYTQLLNGSNPTSDLKRSVLDITLQTYLEYGLGNNLTLVGVLPFKMLQTGDDLLDAPLDLYPNAMAVAAGKHQGLSNVSLALKYQFYNQGFVASAQLGTSMPASAYQAATGLRNGYDCWSFSPRLLVGKGFNKAYLTASAGLEFRTNNYAHNVTGSVEYGYGLAWNEQQKTWFTAVMNIYLPISNGTYNDDTSVHTGLYQDEASYVSPGIKINHGINKNWWINVSAYGAVYANHGGAFPTLNVGIAYEW